MSRPLFPESNLTKLAREKGGREQLERRPAPAAAASTGAGGWPTWHRPLYGMHSLRFENTTGSSNWKTFADTTKYSTFKYQNSDPTGVTFYNNSVAYFGMYLGPAGSIWQMSIVHDNSANGCLLTYKWATDVPIEDGITADPSTLTYYEAEDASISMNIGGATVIDIEQDLSIMRINGAEGDQLTANAPGSDPTYTWAADMNGGPGLWWLKLSVSDGGTSDYECVMREILVSRYAGDGVAWLN